METNEQKVARKHKAILSSVRDSGYDFTTQDDRDTWGLELAKYIIFSGKRPSGFHKCGVTFYDKTAGNKKSKHIPYKYYIEAKMALWESRYLTA